MIMAIEDFFFEAMAIEDMTLLYLIIKRIGFLSYVVGVFAEKSVHFSEFNPQS